MKSYVVIKLLATLESNIRCGFGETHQGTLQVHGPSNTGKSRCGAASRLKAQSWGGMNGRTGEVSVTVN